MPFFSIVIPLYNKENFIQDTLKSVLNQTFKDYEIIIVDDGSTDKSIKKIKEFSDKRIRIIQQENQGVSVARNEGIAESESDYIAFLDADDYWYSHFLEEIHKHISIYSEHKVFACAIEFQIKDKIIPSVYSIEKRSNCQVVDYFEGSLKQSAIWSSSSVFEKSVFEKSGFFNPKYQAGEDTDLWVRVGLHFPVVFIWKIGARYVFDQNSLSFSRKKLASKADFEEYSESEKQNPKLKKFLDYNRFSLAIEGKLSGDKITFSKFKNKIDKKNLPLKKRILLKLPTSILLFLIELKKKMVLLGIGNSHFK